MVPERLFNRNEHEKSRALCFRFEESYQRKMMIEISLNLCGSDWISEQIEGVSGMQQGRSAGLCVILGAAAFAEVLHPCVEG